MGTVLNEPVEVVTMVQPIFWRRCSRGGCSDQAVGSDSYTQGTGKIGRFSCLDGVGACFLQSCHEKAEFRPTEND